MLVQMLGILHCLTANGKKKNGSKLSYLFYTFYTGDFYTLGIQGFRLNAKLEGLEVSFFAIGSGYSRS